MFLSAEKALNWAYNTTGKPIVKMSAINYMRQVPTKGEVNMLLIDLSPYDQHGQAAQIVGMVERLDDPAKRQYIAARFGRRLARDDLTNLVLLCRGVLGFGFDRSEAVCRIVRGYFDGSSSHREIRKALGCRDQYAVMVRSSVCETLDVIHAQAMADITEALREHGLIRSTSSYA